MCCVIIYVYSGEKREFNVGQFFADLFTVGLEAVAFGGAAKGLRNAETASWCFVAGTLVATEDGQKPIEEIQAGDKVLSENPETGEVAYKTVEETYENETTELVHVFVNGEEIITTPSHPFYVPKLGWTLAIKLRAGDILVLSNGEYVVVEAIQHELLESPIKVYNFEVEDFHTYFVGESSVLVHNMCAPMESPRKYNPSPKHDPVRGWGSKNPIPDVETGQKLLDTAYSSSKNKQLYNMYDGQLVKFQPDETFGWHAYAVTNTATEVPSDVLKQMLDDNVITKSQYKKFIKNK